MKKFSVIIATALVLSSLTTCSAPSLAIQQTKLNTLPEEYTEYHGGIFDKSTASVTAEDLITNASSIQNMDLLLATADHAYLIETKSSGEVALQLAGKKTPPIKSTAEVIASCKNALPDKSVRMKKDNIRPYIKDDSEILSNIALDNIVFYRQDSSK